MGKIIFKKYWENETGVTPLVQWTYTLPNFRSITYDMNTPVAPMPMPEEDASENILVKIEGNSSAITINWVIKDQSTGTVTETNTGGTESAYASSTIREQVNFFKDVFRPTSVSSAYELVIRLDEADPTKDINFNGTFSGFNFNMMSPSLLTFNATAKFMEGTVASLYEVDTASAPINVTLTSPSAGQINASWTAPTDSGASSIIDYKIYYRKWFANQNWSSTNVGSSATTKSDISGSTNLPAGTYEVYVEAFTTGLGLGRSSFIQYINVVGV
tara:strand:+ start:1436 stop:2254 length:819 start_codon:yes stop_codon:yes gene_type:complete